MNALFVYPKFKTTFWSWEYILKFVGKKAAFPPLGLLTIAALLPDCWSKKLVDLNAQDKLNDRDIRHADYIFVGAMTAQKDSAKEVIVRCKKLGKKVCLGGPILETGWEEFPEVDHFFVGEAEETLPEFVDDLKTNSARKVYQANRFPDISLSPIPLWNLINPKNYASLSNQFSRGCPHRCTYCRVAAINGRNPRTKSSERFVEEIETIYRTGYRGHVMISDDNFIGNIAKAKEALLAIAKWQKLHGNPFDFTAEVDVRLADDKELMQTMLLAGIFKVFLGIETPIKESLVECRKLHNVRRNLRDCVKQLQNHGLQVLSGFMVGFDSDPPQTFAKQMIEFIQTTGIVIAMPSIVQAQQGTELYQKLEQQCRLLKEISGDNTDCHLTHIPKMEAKILLEGFREITQTIYSPKEYYKRICIFLREYGKLVGLSPKKIDFENAVAFLKSVWFIGMARDKKVAFYYWKTLFTALFKHPKAFSEAITLQIYGAHFFRLTKAQQ